LHDTSTINKTIKYRIKQRQDSRSKNNNEVKPIPSISKIAELMQGEPPTNNLHYGFYSVDSGKNMPEIFNKKLKQ